MMENINPLIEGKGGWGKLEVQVQGDCSASTGSNVVSRGDVWINTKQYNKLTTRSINNCANLYIYDADTSAVIHQGGFVAREFDISSCNRVRVGVSTATMSWSSYGGTNCAAMLTFE